MTEINATSLLYPADIQEILEEFQDIFQTYDHFSDRESIYANYRSDAKRLEVVFPLKEHPIHGNTGLRAYEKYNEAGFHPPAYAAYSRKHLRRHRF
ncbi:hypothetical protein [Paenibacillus daejeonensis]|uniref:hypothetical protein n=1 Tax=Paenibacillus daejeonensis TaxID=135193 RepID=UPI0003A151B8|nr:hypothetical protein [Paenibacillus daejeonensis]